MVEVRTRVGAGFWETAEADATLGIGVIGARGLCSVFVAVTEGLHAGVAGDGAAIEI